MLAVQMTIFIFILVIITKCAKNIKLKSLPNNLYTIFSICIFMHMYVNVWNSQSKLGEYISICTSTYFQAHFVSNIPLKWQLYVCVCVCVCVCVRACVYVWVCVCVRARVLGHTYTIKYFYSVWVSVHTCMSTLIHNTTHKNTPDPIVEDITLYIRIISLPNQCDLNCHNQTHLYINSYCSQVN